MKVLAYTSPARGHIYPIVPTLLELRSRGHQVAVRTLASEVELLGQLGLAASPMSPLIEAREMDDWRGKNQLAQLQRALTAFVERAEHEVPDLAKAIKTNEPDLLLVDVNSWGAQGLCGGIRPRLGGLRSLPTADSFEGRAPVWPWAETHGWSIGPGAGRRTAAPFFAGLEQGPAAAEPCPRHRRSTSALERDGHVRSGSSDPCLHGRALRIPSL